MKNYFFECNKIKRMVFKELNSPMKKSKNIIPAMIIMSMTSSSNGSLLKILIV